MDISIIIPVYNRANIVTATLNSVAQQSFRPLELILVDNNSSDCSLEILHKFKAENEAPDFRITVLQEKAKGAAAARNCGLKHATTEWIMFFDSDDIMAPDLVESYSSLAKDNPDADLLVCKASNQMLNGTVRTLPYVEGDIFANHLIHCMLSTQRYIARREHFLKVGAWNADMLAWNDWELGVRMLLHSEHVAYRSDKARVLTISQAESITGEDFFSKRGLWEKAIDAVENAITQSNHAHKTRLLRIVNYRRAVLAAHYCKEGHPSAADSLMRKAKTLCNGNIFHSLLLSIAYTYIRRGGRGFGRLIRLLA